MISFKVIYKTDKAAVIELGFGDLELFPVPLPDPSCSRGICGKSTGSFEIF